MLLLVLVLLGLGASFGGARHLAHSLERLDAPLATLAAQLALEQPLGGTQGEVAEVLWVIEAVQEWLRELQEEEATSVGRSTEL